MYCLLVFVCFFFVNIKTKYIGGTFNTLCIDYTINYTWFLPAKIKF